MKSAIILFADDPLPVFTNRGPDGKPDELALALLRDTLRNLADTDADVFVFLSPDQDKDEARDLLGKGGFKLAAAHGRDLKAQHRNACRLVFARNYTRALLLSNAMPDLPAHSVQSALDFLNWKCVCLGPAPESIGGEPDGIYALGFDFEGYSTDVFDHVPRDRPKVFTRLETLLLFYDRKLKVLPPYRPITSLDMAGELAARCADTRFALLPSVRLATARAKG